MFHKLKYLFLLARPNNLIIAFLSIWVAALVAGSIQPLINVTLASLSAVLITIGANVINDIFDIEIDRINKPKRPLPAGKVSKQDAFIFFVVTYLLAWSLAYLINIKALIVAVTFGLLLILYSYKLKRTLIVGNFVVSLTTAMAFIYGGLAVDRISGTIFPALFAFFFHFGREIIKDLQDVVGDQAAGAKTFAIRYGPRASLILTTIIFLLLSVLTLVPFITGTYGGVYITVIIAGIYPILIYVLYQCWTSPDPATLGKMSAVLKADMLVGLLAIYLG